MLGFTAGVCKSEGHWLSVEPVDSKSFSREERREVIAKWFLGFLLFVFSYHPQWWHVGYSGPWRAQKSCLVSKARGLFNLLGDCLARSL